jgi:hypothetical protein
MTPKRIASLAFTLLVALPVYALEDTHEVPPLPDRNPARVQSPVAQAPVLPGDRPTVPWTDAEIAAAKADCAKALAGVPVDYEPLPPLKEGICGAPAPILVKSIGSDPKVVIDPPAAVTCPLARALSAWLSKTVQPEAKAVLGSQVVKLHNATSYACRNRYGSATTPLSEHALANALDVSEFVFASGEHITVLEGWPRLAKAPPPPAPNPSRVADVTGSVVPVSHTHSLVVGALAINRIKANPFEAPTPPPEARAPEAAAPSPQSVVAKNVQNPFVAPAPAAESTPSDAKPSEAMPSDVTSPSPSLSEREGVFVKTVHDDACNTFGTVLGPEANEAHKNHFHLDMKARRDTAFCE